MTPPASPVRRRVPWLCLGAGAAVVAGAAGVWHAAVVTERARLDRLQQQLAQHAGAYLGVVTPGGSAGGYDAARLLSGANALAGATFWPGGMQLVLGTTALIPDDIGLLPLPDSVQVAVDRGAPMFVLTHAEERAVLVPFLGPQNHYLGWLGTWGAQGNRLPGPGGLILTALAALALVLAVWSCVRRAALRQRLLAAGALGLALLLMGREIHQELDAVGRAAIQTRLETVRKLIELAATAERVRQADLPAIAVDIAVAVRRGLPLADSGVVWHDSVASISAATPRTQASLQLAVPVPEPPALPAAPWETWYLLSALGVAVLLAGRSRAR